MESQSQYKISYNVFYGICGGVMADDKGVTEKLSSFEIFLSMKEWTFPRFIAFFISLTAVTLSIYHLFCAYFGQANATEFRSTHLTFILILAFLIKPSEKSNPNKITAPFLIDLLLIFLTAAVQAYILYDTNAFLSRTGEPSVMDVVMGTILIVVLLEATRRTLGWVLTSIVIVFLLDARFAEHLIWLFEGPSTKWETIVDYMFIQNEGVYGIPLMVISSYVVLFFIFGSLFLETGVGKFFIDFALALAGRKVGGPAKTACIASGIFGSVTGVATANVATTGTFTIPLMRRVGYSPIFAGAVEAAASTGGQIMPPIMGSAAFIIAEFMGVPYLEVCIAAAIPSLLYVLSVYFMVHYRAKKLNLRPLPEEELPDLKAVLKRGAYLFTPIFLIIGLLVSGRSPVAAAFWGIVSVVGLALLRKDTRIKPVKLIAALESAVKGCVPVSLACAVVGIIIGCSCASGIGLSFTSTIVALSGGHLWIALILIMVSALVLGMGMTAVAVYITLAALVIPALVEMGVPTIGAHLFPFYYGIVSVVTPPVALAAYVAAGLTKADPVKTGYQAFRLSIAAFIIPFMFVYGPELLMIGTPLNIFKALCTSILGIILLAAAIEGWFLHRMNILERLFAIAASILLISPTLLTDLAGFSVAAVLFIYQRGKSPEVDQRAFHKLKSTP